MTIDNIEITADSIRNSIEFYYPNTLSIIEDKELYYYMALFGIRVSTCDTGLPDDFLGAIRFVPNKFSSGGYWEMILSDGTTDPSPKWLAKLYDNEARLKGGTAWVKEGQYVYKRYGNFKGYPAFMPVGNIKVYRWNQKKPGEQFDKSKAMLSDSSSTLIHRSWATTRFSSDSAGCQVFKNNGLLRDIDNWAITHNSQKNYPKQYTYTLLSKNEFVNANTQTKQSSFWDNFGKIF
jgi:hypothetical protein